LGFSPPTGMKLINDRAQPIAKTLISNGSSIFEGTSFSSFIDQANSRASLLRISKPQGSSFNCSALESTVEMQINMLPLPNNQPNLMNEIKTAELNEMTIEKLTKEITRR